jgi:hypothetical protein
MGDKVRRVVTTHDASQDTPSRVIVSVVEALRVPTGGGMPRPTP